MRPISIFETLFFGVMGFFVVFGVPALIFWGMHLRDGDRLWCKSHGLQAVEIPAKTMRMYCSDSEGRLIIPETRR